MKLKPKPEVDWGGIDPEGPVEVITTAVGAGPKGLIPVGTRLTVKARNFSNKWMREVDQDIVEPEDDLQQIKGIGPALAARLADVDITSFAQIAAWTEEDIARLDEELDLKGSITSKDWQGQAKALME